MKGDIPQVTSGWSANPQKKATLHWLALCGVAIMSAAVICVVGYQLWRLAGGAS